MAQGVTEENYNTSHFINAHPSWGGGKGFNLNLNY